METSTGTMPTFFNGFERIAIHVGCGRFLHPLGKVADAQAFDACFGIEIEFAGDALQVARIGAGDGVQNEQAVFDAARHRAEFVERPAESHRAGARDAAVRGTQAGDAATHAGRNDAAAGFAADGKADESCGGGCTRASTGAGSAFFGEPGIYGLAAEPDVVERERAEAELGDEDRTGSVKALDDGGVVFGNAIAERFGAISGGNAGGVEKIFSAPGDSVERTAVLPCRDFGVGLLGLLQGEIFRERDDAEKFGIKFFEASEINLREALGGDLFCFDPTRKMGDGRKGNRIVVLGQRGSCARSDEAIFFGPIVMPGSAGFQVE